MALPAALLQSLHGLPGFDDAAFRAVHEQGAQVTSVRINPAKPAEAFDNFPQPMQPVPWSRLGYYLSSRPSFTFDPLFHAGCYYVQEASSMFLEQAIRQCTADGAALKVLDLCASPGGKSTHLQSLLSEGSLLVSNEVIRSRAAVLKDNIIRWGSANVVVTNNDPADFSKLENYFDVVVVDAPCSGSGLFRRDPDAIEEWSENNVALCSQRQQRILADVWPALKPDGILIYSTCSYSREEDEAIVQWLRNDLGATSRGLILDKGWNIIATDGGYRFWPDKVEGEGFFLACLSKPGGTYRTQIRIKRKPTPVAKADQALLANWINTNALSFIRHNDTVYAWPEYLAEDFSFLLQELRVMYSGVLVGELLRHKLVPAHSLAMSTLMPEDISAAELDLDQAIRYLQRKDLVTGSFAKGWQLATYNEQALGWMNVLPNRVNNYYPRELRILKDN